MGARKSVKRKPKDARGKRSEMRQLMIGGAVLCILVAIGVHFLSPYVSFKRIFEAADQPRNAPIFGMKVVFRLPHSRTSFTQGFIYENGTFVETIGHYGQSRILRLDGRTAEVTAEHKFMDSEFAEGLSTLGNGSLAVLTWLSGKGYVVNGESLTFVREWTYPGDGWGLTYNRKSRELYLSDGTATIRVLEPVHLTEKRRFVVRDNGRHIHLLNELEFIHGEIWANVYGTLLLARINPSSGVVNSWVDCSGILSPEDGVNPSDLNAVMNGIAFDEAKGRLFLTGKYWPHITQIETDIRQKGDDVAIYNPIFLNRRNLKVLQGRLFLEQNVNHLPP